MPSLENGDRLNGMLPRAHGDMRQVLDLRPVMLVVGILLATLGCAMMLPAFYDLAVDNSDWIVFAAASGLTLFVGIALAIANRGQTQNLNIRQAFLLTTIAWLALTTFSALPFAWSTLNASFTDAFFEAMSGITTTGATVFTGLDKAPPGILLWRSILQWLGGVGIIVMAIAVLPMLRIGGMQLFRMESSDNSEKILPRATQFAGSLSLLYLVLTVLCALGYHMAGMRLFDAVAHAMTTIATGGFSTRDASIGAYDSVAVESVSIFFMIVGSLPFVLYLQALQGRVQPLLRDSQVRWFFAVLIVFVLMAWGAQATGGHEVGMLEFRDAAFNTVSIMTGTGYATVDYGKWSLFSTTLFFCIMFVGGCAGSTSCGVKIFRFQVIYENIKQHVWAIVHPRGVFVARYNGRPLSENVSSSVMSFVFLFLLCFAAISGLLALYGLDTVTAFSASASALANVGPGLGDIVGPAGTYKDLPDGVKWILSFAMLLGRLELFTVLVLVLPAFWRS